MTNKAVMSKSVEEIKLFLSLQDFTYKITKDMWGRKYHTFQRFQVKGKDRAFHVLNYLEMVEKLKERFGNRKKVVRVDPDVPMQDFGEAGTQYYDQWYLYAWDEGTGNLVEINMDLNEHGTIHLGIVLREDLIAITDAIVHKAKHDLEAYNT